jgi:superfamily II RNA helicase
MEKNYDPVIIFAFSKRECEALAASMHNLDLNNEDERLLQRYRKPLSKVDCKPVSKVDCKPLSKVDCKLLSKVDCKLLSKVDCKPPSKVDCKQVFRGANLHKRARWAQRG